MTTTDETRVTDKEIEASIEWSRKWLHTAGLEPISYRMYSTIVALADRLAARAEEYAASVNDLSAKLAARDAEIAEVLDFFGSFDLLCRVVPVGAIKSRCGACQRCLSAAFLSKHGRRTP